MTYAYPTNPFVGRLVFGDPFAFTGKTYQGRAVMNEKTGAQVMECQIGLAVEKGPLWDALYADLWARAAADFPNGEFNLPTFSWKFKDGDLPAYAGRDGWPGHVIVVASTRLGAPEVFSRLGGTLQQIVDPKSIKRGDYLQPQISFRGNGDQNKPGIYINLSRVCLVGYGLPIHVGPSPEEAFAQQGALPAGASQTPIATPGAQPAAMPAAQPQYAAPPAAQPQYVAPPVPGTAPPLPAPAGAPPPLPAAAPGAIAPDPRILDPQRPR